LEQDGAGIGEEVGFCKLRIVVKDLLVKRHYAALAKKPWK
jgi:hypothetical protein